jgi:hypothetical protein
MDWMWWITAIELPALGGLFWLLQAHRTAVERELKALRDDLVAFKLHVATGYASIVYLKDVESRLTAHLLKIEAKLDRVVDRALLAGHPGPPHAADD